VLAGVMTLSALSGTPGGGVLLGLAYVFGMVFPLLVMALAWDKLHLSGRSFLRARPVRLRLAGHTIVTSTINIAVAAGFAVMGGFIFYLAGAGQMTGGPGFQVAIGRALGRLFRRVEVWTAPVPELVLGLALLALAAVFVAAALRDRGRAAPANEPGVGAGPMAPAPPRRPGRRTAADDDGLVPVRNQP